MSSALMSGEPHYRAVNQLSAPAPPPPANSAVVAESLKIPRHLTSGDRQSSPACVAERIIEFVEERLDRLVVDHKTRPDRVVEQHPVCVSAR